MTWTQFPKAGTRPTMNRMLSIALFFALLQDPVSLFEVDLWPGEGRPVLEAVSRTLKLRELPLASSNIIRTVSVSPNQRLTFDDTRYRTTLAGRVRVVAPTIVRGRLLGPIGHLSKDEYYQGKFPPASLAIRAGANVEILQYRAEGTCFVRIARNVIDAESCPSNDKSKFRVETEPKTEWWIHVVISRNVAGWILVTDSSVKVVNRNG